MSDQRPRKRQRSYGPKLGGKIARQSQIHAGVVQRQYHRQPRPKGAVVLCKSADEAKAADNRITRQTLKLRTPSKAPEGPKTVGKVFVEARFNRLATNTLPTRYGSRGRFGSVTRMFIAELIPVCGGLGFVPRCSVGTTLTFSRGFEPVLIRPLPRPPL